MYNMHANHIYTALPLHPLTLLAPMRQSCQPMANNQGYYIDAPAKYDLQSPIRVL